jgi:hypothetical protein
LLAVVVFVTVFLLAGIDAGAETITSASSISETSSAYSQSS